MAIVSLYSCKGVNEKEEVCHVTTYDTMTITKVVDEIIPFVTFPSAQVTSRDPVTASVTFRDTT